VEIDGLKGIKKNLFLWEHIGWMSGIKYDLW